MRIRMLRLAAPVMFFSVPLVAGPHEQVEKIEITSAGPVDEPCTENLVKGNHNTATLEACLKDLRGACSQLLDTDNACENLKTKMSKALDEIEGGQKKCMSKAEALAMALNCEGFQNSDLENKEDYVVEIANAFGKIRPVTKGQEQRRHGIKEDQRAIRKGAGASRHSADKKFERQSANLTSNEKGEHIVGGGPVDPTPAEDSGADKPKKGVKQDKSLRELYPTTPPRPYDSSARGPGRFGVDSSQGKQAFIDEFRARGCSEDSLNKLLNDMKTGKYAGKTLQMPSGHGCQVTGY